jgi:hypothetical protein
LEVLRDKVFSQKNMLNSFHHHLHITKMHLLSRIKLRDLVLVQLSNVRKLQKLLCQFLDQVNILYLQRLEMRQLESH